MQRLVSHIALHTLHLGQPLDLAASGPSRIDYLSSYIYNQINCLNIRINLSIENF